LGALKRNRRLHGHGFKEQQILFYKAASLIVKRLSHSDNIASHGSDGNTEDILCSVARLLIHGTIEMFIRIRVTNNPAVSGRKDMAGDPPVIEDPDFAL
jgi:hypothetical protein